MPETTIEAPEPDKHEFRLVEYHEAASSYANGVEIGFNSTKGFFAINAALIAIYFSPTDTFASVNILLYLQSLAPIFGIVSGAVLAVLIPPYFQHLENCRTRCTVIEGIYGGTLFKGNDKVGRRWADTRWMLFGLAAVALFGWGLLLYLLFVSP
jgi:hypothetical protein